MKFSALTLVIAVGGLIALSSAFPAQKRLMYYQHPAQYHTAPQRLMYVQYMHPSPYARSTQAAEVLVAGESVATGTYLQDCDHAEADISAAGPAVSYEAPLSVDIESERGEDELSEAGAHATQAKAEAYPADEPSPAAEGSVTAFEVPADVDIVAEENEVPDDEAKVPREFNFDSPNYNNAGEAVAAEDIPQLPAVEIEAPAELPAEVPVSVESASEAGVVADLPVPAPIVPIAEPVNSYLPAKKKVYVELDQSVEDTDLAVASEEAEDEEEEEKEHIAPVATVTRRPARRPAVKKPSKAAPQSKEQKPLPVGTFFPINFGGTKGGAIAIANSFSTGEGGSATSHAIAYGSPDAAASLRGCVSCKKH